MILTIILAIILALLIVALVLVANDSFDLIDWLEDKFDYDKAFELSEKFNDWWNNFLK